MILDAVYTPEAARRIRRLDPVARERVRQAIERLGAAPESGKRLAGVMSGRWSCRVGGWRVICRIERERLRILVVTVDHRREVYRR